MQQQHVANCSRPAGLPSSSYSMLGCKRTKIILRIVCVCCAVAITTATLPPSSPPATATDGAVVYYTINDQPPEPFRHRGRTNTRTYRAPFTLPPGKVFMICQFHSTPLVLQLSKTSIIVSEQIWASSSNRTNIICPHWYP